MIKIEDNNSTIVTDEIKQNEKPNEVPCDVSIIEKYDTSFLESLITWLSPLVPAEIGAIATAVIENHKFTATKMDTDQIKVEVFSSATGLPVTLISVLGKILAYPEATLLNYIATIAKVKADQEYKEGLIKEEYLEKYGDKWNAENVVINIDSTNEENDIKKYLSYSGVLDQGIPHIYVKESTETTYELISVRPIYEELVERGFYSHANVSEYGMWEFVKEVLQAANPSYDFTERYVDNTYGKTIEKIDVCYLLLKNNEKLLFPTEYDGDWSVKLYAPDSHFVPLIGGNGNDSLYGGVQNDSLSGNNGNDIIYGGDNFDNIHGGEGNDTIYGASNDGTAEIFVFPQDGVVGEYNSKGNYLYGDAGDDIIWAGGTGNDYLDGGSGNDTLHASGTVSATLFGNTGDDSLLGADGNDIINGGEGNDYLDGGKGNDLLKGSEGNDEIHGGIGADTIYGNNTTITTGDGKNNLYGDAGSDYLVASDSNDLLDGGTNNDVLIAGLGNDLLIGGLGDDYLYGEAMKDTLIGGSGDDKLFGGEGQDTYIFNIGDGQDVIEDFNAIGFPDTIKFGSNITPSDIEFVTQGDDLSAKRTNINKYNLQMNRRRCSRRQSLLII